jgi:protein SCO1
MHRREILKAAMLAVGAAAAGLPLQSIAATATATTAASMAKGGLPSDSVYQLGTHLTNQAGKDFVLGDQRGTPLIVSMFSTSCQMVCPMLVEAIKATEQKLSEGDRKRVNVLLVTFDPQVDTVAVLQKTAKDRQLDEGHWTLARTDAASVRKLASVLGIQYKALGNGDFNHSNSLILLDGEGRVSGRTSRLGDADPAFVKSVKTLLASSAH